MTIEQFKRIDDLENEVRALQASRDLARERWAWWQKNAEDIAKERAELFRAGEAMYRIGHRKTVEWDAWDAAAQPIRDMIASLPVKPDPV